jgi:hypothetical protein
MVTYNVVLEPDPWVPIYVGKEEGAYVVDFGVLREG